eukprot:4859991-Prymnesium_polylepis.1
MCILRFRRGMFSYELRVTRCVPLEWRGSMPDGAALSEIDNRSFTHQCLVKVRTEAPSTDARVMLSLARAGRRVSHVRSRARRRQGAIDLC